MVRIAIAGGTSSVALEVIDALCAANKHDILLMSRKQAPVDHAQPGVSWLVTNYQDPERLALALKGVHTVLSFIVTQSDPGGIAQKNLIDAAVKAGVKRFAPSEWTISSFEYMPWYAGKAEIREYLQELNRGTKVLEYCLFLPGLFTNYFTHPHKSAKHFNSFQTHIDFENRRALILEGSEEDRITLTTAQDFAAVVAQAVEYDGEWPVTGGIKGTEFSLNQLLELGEKVRGGGFHVERLWPDDLKAGVLNSSWYPSIEHSGIPDGQTKALVAQLVAGMLLGTSAGALNVTDEWNKLLPDYEFTQASDFLTVAWAGKA